MPTAPQLPETLPGLLEQRAALTPTREAYRQFDVLRKAWISYTWTDMGARVRRWRAGLQAEGLAAGARVALLVPNSIEHVCMDQAALAAGCVPVPLHVVDNPENLAYVLGDCGASVLLVDTAARWDALLPYRERFQGLKRVVCLRDCPEEEIDIRVGIERWLSLGDGQALQTPAGISSESLAAVVYTSGTTGRPKGVMLSHGNVLANIRALLSTIAVYESDILLSFLPLSHTFERTVGYYLPIAAGATVAYARSVSQLTQDLKTVRPTVLVSVPRIYERAHMALRESTERRVATRWLFTWAVRIGWRAFESTHGRASVPSAPLRSLAGMLDRVVGAPLRARFGGRLRLAVSGGAALAADIARPFLALGLPLLQGYGMTECAPVVSCNSLEDNDPASVGRALPGVQVRIGENDELLVRGENVMMGYWGRSEETALVLDHDGWLHTGDQARITDGRIYIKGRIKDIIVTSTGEKIAPADLEAAIQNDPAFDQAVVLGENRPYLAALAILNRERWLQQAHALGLNPTDPSSVNAPSTTRWAIERIQRALQGFPHYATPRAVFLSLDPWSVANGLITPTLKPKRAALESRFATEIAALYRGHT
jgi:long-chain acyl-CoA synthetase